jgi:ankyrin repeat protein
MTRALDSAPASPGIEALLDAALAGRDDEVASALAQSPSPARQSIHVAAAIADRDAIAVQLEAEPSLATRTGGRRAWTPLLYVCCSRYRRRQQDSIAARIAIARALLERGADPNEKGADPGYGNEEWRPLSGAANPAVSPGLVRLLVFAGASAMKTPGVLTHAVEGGDLEVLRLLLEGSPPDWYQIGWALLACVEYDRVELVRVLIEHASPADVGSTLIARKALQDAIRRHRSADVIDVLLGSDSTEVGNAVRQDLYRAAIRYDHDAAAILLERRGVRASAATAIDRAIGAAVRGDRTELDRWRQSAAFERARLRGEDHRMVAWAIRHGRRAAVPLLLDLGLDPNVADVDGEMPLHLATKAGDVEIVEALLQAEADVHARNFDAETPLDAALSQPHRVSAASDSLEDPGVATRRETMIARLIDAGAASDPSVPALEGNEEIFERAADAVCAGDLETLRALLDREPALVYARSPRPHRCTLLNYCAANGTEDPRQRTPANAPAIAALLLDRGADPNATCQLYGGAFSTMSLMLTSAHPAAARLDGDLTRVLLAGGARLEIGDLMGAIEYGLTRAVDAFVEAGAPAANLFVAAGLGRLDVMDALLSTGAGVNERFEDGGFGTALHAAAAMDQADAAGWLLDRGADPTLLNRWESTPDGTAAFFHHDDVAALIRARRHP